MELRQRAEEAAAKLHEAADGSLLSRRVVMALQDGVNPGFPAGFSNFYGASLGFM